MTQTHWLNDMGGNFTGAWDGSGWVAPRAAATIPAGPLFAAQASGSGFSFINAWDSSGWVAPRAAGTISAGSLLAAQTSGGGFSLNVATGQDAAGNIQTAGDLADAHWTVTNADSYKNGPIAYTTAPGNADWYFGGGSESAWLANGPGSSWIAANPDSSANGAMTFTLKFDLTGYNPAYATLAGGGLAADDQGAVYLNGHLLGTSARYGWGSLLALSNGAGDFVAGVNTLVIQITLSDNFLEAARLEGTIVDTVSASTPIRWASAVSGYFAAAAAWKGGIVPGAANDAILDPQGAAFTVTAAFSKSVNSIQTAANATLDITGGTFTAALGTGGGSNGGAIVVGDGAAFAFGGTLANIGSIDLGASGHATELIVGASGGALVGGGAVALSDNARNLIIAGTPGAPLTNIDNTITGAGEIGGGGLRLANSATGVIEATGATGLVIALGPNSMENAGLMEATGAGGLILRGVTVDGSSGGVIAAGNASHVALQGADLIGGTLQSTGTGLILTFLGANQLDGTSSAVTNQARLILHNSTALTLQGSIVNTNQIDFYGSGADTRLEVGAAGATLSGGGVVILDNQADNIITGVDGAATLTNVDNTLSGAGQLGLGSLTLINEAKGAIVGSHAIALTLDTGANTIVNAGRIVADGAGGVSIKSAVANSGLLEAEAGVMTVDGAVSGTGEGVIFGGTLDFAASFSQNVIFQKTTGVLELAQSQSYAGAITGFSKTGGTSLDLGDIGFVSSAEATFSGAASGGTLTVTDGTHTAHIALQGDYTASTFIASSDGHGGTIIIDPAAPAAAHRFVAAAAGLGAGTGGGAMALGHDAWRTPPPMLGKPAAMIA